MEELIKLLKTDPSLLIQVIVWNNPSEVVTNFASKTDADLSNEEQIIEQLELFRADGFEDVVAEVISVPFLTENANEDLTNAYTSLRDQSGNVLNGLYKSVQSAIDRDNKPENKQVTAQQLTTKTKKKKVAVVGSVTSVALLALIIIFAIFVASKIKI